MMMKKIIMGLFFSIALAFSGFSVVQASNFADGELIASSKCGTSKCGSGKCGTSSKKCGEGKCGKSSKCGDSKKMMKCGEGKCGKSSKCGTSKCGTGKCGGNS
jgi:uncharacterized low-complexity protein